jgi:hypothetical protein
VAAVVAVVVAMVGVACMQSPLSMSGACMGFRPVLVLGGKGRKTDGGE